MVIFGGAGLDKENASVNLADLYMLNTTTMVWSQPEVKGAIPQVWGASAHP